MPFACEGATPLVNSQQLWVPPWHLHKMKPVSREWEGLTRLFPSEELLGERFFFRSVALVGCSFSVDDSTTMYVQGGLSGSVKTKGT